MQRALQSPISNICSLDFYGLAHAPRSRNQSDDQDVNDVLVNAPSHGISHDVFQNVTHDVAFTKLLQIYCERVLVTHFDDVVGDCLSMGASH